MGDSKENFSLCRQGDVRASAQSEFFLLCVSGAIFESHIAKEPLYFR